MFEMELFLLLCGVVLFVIAAYDKVNRRINYPEKAAKSANSLKVILPALAWFIAVLAVLSSKIVPIIITVLI